MINLSLSNIGWNNLENEIIFQIMSEWGFHYLEIAPLKVFPNIEPAQSQINDFIDNVANFGITPVAMQSLLFGKPDFVLFEEKFRRDQTIDYLKQVIDLGTELGIKSYVFGSPANRRIPSGCDNFLEIACEFFNILGDYAAEKGSSICIEPNPPEYGTNFLNYTADAAEFVKCLNNKGIGLNIDTGTLILNQENPEELLKEYLKIVKHVHISEPFLKPIDENEEYHRKVATSLLHIKYPYTVSIEMGLNNPENNIPVLKKTMEFVASLYLP